MGQLPGQVKDQKTSFWAKKFPSVFCRILAIYRLTSTQGSRVSNKSIRKLKSQLSSKKQDVFGWVLFSADLEVFKVILEHADNILETKHELQVYQNKINTV